MRTALFDKKYIENIFDNQGLEKVVHIEEIKRGSINPVFLLNDKYILRIDTGDSDNKDKFKKEAILFGTLPKFSIPVPEVIIFDDSCNLIEYPFILMEYIEGKDLKDVFVEQSHETQQQLSSELGILARKIHSVTANDLYNNAIFGNIDQWVEKEKYNYAKYWKLVKQGNQLSNEISDEIEKTFSNYQQISRWKGVGRLIHGDFSCGNIKINDGHIVGIFDFEFAGIGDPLYDLQKSPISFQLGADFDKCLFMNSYTTEEFTDQEKTRLKMYSLIQGLWEIWATETKQLPYGQKEIEEGKQLITNAIKDKNFL